MRRLRWTPPTPLPYWLGAATVALVAAVIVGGLAARSADAIDQWGRTSAVPVATHDLAAGTVLRPSDVTLRELPAALVPSGAVRALPVGRTVVAAVFSGEVLVEGRLAPAGLSAVAALVPEGSRAIAVPYGPAAVPLAVGDRVDIIGGSSPIEATVLAVNESAVTVAVDEREVVRAATLVAEGLAILALRGS